MAAVLVAVALLTTSIWIAIRMEPGLDAPVRPALPADTDTARPARCRFQPKAGLPAARPVRCTQRPPKHPVPPCPAGTAVSPRRDGTLRRFVSEAI